MNNAEFIAHCTKVLCMNIATPPDWNEGEIMREALDRLAAAEKRIEELQNLARWAERAKVAIERNIEGDYEYFLTDVLKDYPQAEGEK